ncbi:MAG TPA: hypothetical protein VD969_03425 [Symbiobacteriaceae bacterium]|nr:hypothetical protein [Symbiobacteriaceae bacterium]
MHEVPLYRLELLRRAFERARVAAHSLQAGEPDLSIPLREVTAAPVMRLLGGKAVYLWDEGDRVRAVAGHCPRDGLTLYHRRGEYLCPTCGVVDSTFLEPIQVTVRDEKAVFCFP